MTGDLKYKQVFLAAFLFLAAVSVSGQESRRYTLAFAADNAPGHDLVFNKDRVTFAYPPDPIEGFVSFGSSAWYTETDSTIVIFPEDPRSRKSDVHREQILRKVEGGLIGEKDSVIYVLARAKPYARKYIVDGKVFEAPLVSSFRERLSQFPGNPQLSEKLAETARHPEKFDIKVYTGFEAYTRFGIDGAFGVTVIQTKTHAPGAGKADPE